MLFSNVSAGGKLIPKGQWERYVNSLQREADKLGFFSAKAAAERAIYKAMVAAVKNRAEYCKSKNRRFGVLLSGGVDSSFIAFLLLQLGYKFTCFSVGMEGSRDLAAANLFAKKVYQKTKLKFELIPKEYTIAAAEEIIREAVKLLKTGNPVTIGIAATEIAALRLAAANKIRFLFTGLGSEEIFAGYQRHVLAEDVHKECWKGLKGMWQRDFIRDFAVAARFKAAALTPFLDKPVIIAAMRAKPEWKIADGEKKLILREIAAAAGLPKDIAFRPKMAAQYGSGFDKALEKLARAGGFGSKSAYLCHYLSHCLSQ